MRRSRNVIPTLVAWMATSAMVTAGTPAPTCHCADGHVKRFCPGVTGDSGCCCCLSRSPGAEAAPCCCRKQASESTASCPTEQERCSDPATFPSTEPTSSDSPLALNSAACVRTLAVQPAVLAVAEKGAPELPAADAPPTWVFAYAAESLHATAARAASRRPSFLPPSPDLIIALCHFTT
jgi:hypothetical protein